MVGGELRERAVFQRSKRGWTAGQDLLVFATRRKLTSAFCFRIIQGEPSFQVQQSSTRYRLCTHQHVHIHTISQPEMRRQQKNSNKQA
eukprot:c35870_g1_i1 orf=35-298(+)